ncbi:hypothetical protein XENOCAPTIV_011062 [Xenoophorus captivus]|uniref:Uncharacterized protein n=1 Tax=Xenoophorus captivus TaxID=1517983 RepID=A0ABV0RI69_9TELE
MCEINMGKITLNKLYFLKRLEASQPLIPCCPGFYSETSRCIPAQTHLNQMDEFPHRHVILLCRCLVTSYSLDTGVLEKGCIKKLQVSSSRGLNMALICYINVNITLINHN